MIGAIRSAADEPDVPQILGGFTQLAKAKTYAEKFRHLKWCIRQDATIKPDLNLLLHKFNFRTSIHMDTLGFILYLTARPTKLSDFVEHNPELAEELLIEIE